MEVENDGVNATDATSSKLGSQTVLHLQIFEEVLAIMERRRDFNQELYTWIKNTNVPVKQRVAEFEEKSGRRGSSNKLLDRFKDYTDKIARDLARYNDLIPEVRGIISSTNSQEREDAANRLYAYLQWTRKAEDTVFVENANKDFHEIEFYEEMIGQLERLPITDGYKNFHHYITVRVNNTNSDGIECPEYTLSIIASMRKISKIHGPFSKAVEVLMQDLGTSENILQVLNLSLIHI
jgi:hypothetical protein